ncbi:MAG TPA: M1 family aminopeptidase [Gemmatimonadaceae bacterium]
MRPSLATLIIALALAAHAAHAQNPNLESIANDRYTRSHDFDLVHQHIAVRDFNWDSLSFMGSVSTTLIALRPAMDSVILDAGALLGIKRVATSSGSALRTGRHGDTLVIYLARPAAFHDTIHFTVDYSGKVVNGRGLTFIDERPHTPRQIWSQGEDRDNHYWFPTYDFPNDKMTWEVEATVPAGYMAVSNGALVADTKDATGARTLHWRQDRPSASYLVSLVVAPLAKIHDTWKNVPVDYYTYHADSALAWRLFHVTPDMIDVYSRLTGVPYPWQKYAQTTVADFFGGMENVSATTLVDWLPDAKSYQDRPWYQHILIPHELAHQWFGDFVTTENWANMWLNEGFAEFMPGQYWREKSGSHIAEDYYLDEYRQFMQIDARRRMPLASLGSNNIYPKGALVLEMLRSYLGDERFWAGIHRYLTDHAYGNAVSDDLRQAFLDATGENLDWFWSQWVYAAGYPEFTVTSTYDPATHRLTLAVRQTQRDTLKADSAGMRYVVPETFRMPVTVRIGTATGADVVRTKWIRQRDDTIVIDNVASPPTMIVFDDGNRILKRLTFDQPSAQLAAQLRREENLWNRWWVIQQLGARTTDETAVRALADAATSSDYFLTRAQAASALGAFPAGIVVPTLAKAVRDTSSQVRQAAVESLGRVGGAEALALVRGTWRGDDSYSVRASALTALASLDTAGSRAAIVEGLRTPSYRDAIQNAAIGAAVRTDDTTFVTTMQQMIGDQQLPSYALAAMVVRGSDRALKLLLSDLDDARPYVRQWALTAIVQSLGPARGLAALKSVQQTLTHPDTRAAVDHAVKQLEAAAKQG